MPCNAKKKREQIKQTNPIQYLPLNYQKQHSLSTTRRSHHQYGYHHPKLVQWKSVSRSSIPCKTKVPSNTYILRQNKKGAWEGVSRLSMPCKTKEKSPIQYLHTTGKQKKRAWKGVSCLSMPSKAKEKSSIPKRTSNPTLTPFGKMGKQKRSMKKR